MAFWNRTALQESSDKQLTPKVKTTLRITICLCTWYLSPHCLANLSAQERGQSSGRNRGYWKPARPPGWEWLRRASSLAAQSRKHHLEYETELWYEGGGMPRCGPTGTGRRQAREKLDRVVIILHIISALILKLLPVLFYFHADGRSFETCLFPQTLKSNSLEEMSYLIQNIQKGILNGKINHCTGDSPT